MGLRFKILGVAFLVILLVGENDALRPFGNVLDVFIALAVLLVLSAIALWPSSAGADRVDRAVGGASWADRIEFEHQSDKPLD